jgi:CRISPR-associated protein Cas2
MFLVIAYDISDDKRRLRIAKELERWGNRTQFSVFECDLAERDEREMLANLKNICQDNDALRIYRLCAECVKKSEVIGGKELATDQDFYQI